jgi:hypothetical protein
VILAAGKWLAGRILRLVPEGIRGRMLPGRFGFVAAELPPPPRVPDGAVRLFIAPVNYAGQGWHWARAVDAHVEGAGAVNMVARMPSDFGHPADDVVPLGFYLASVRWQRAQRDAVAGGFTHVMIEAEKQPFGAVLDESVASQVSWLRKRGLRVVMVCHGTDIRLPSRHIELNADSPFLDSLAGIARVLERTARRNRALLDRLACPVLVSTPDLLLDVPQATWLPVAVDPDAWSTQSSPLERSRPVVAHAPSSGSVKGSELIDPVLRRLDLEGVIEYRKVEGVPSARMPELYSEADIVLDQFRLGDYGVASCEAMAAGRVVIGHVSEHARTHVHSATGLSLPIVEATVGSLEDVLRAVLDDRERFRTIAAGGVDFVRAVHDGRRSAQVLEGVLL